MNVFDRRIFKGVAGHPTGAALGAIVASVGATYAIEGTQGAGRVGVILVTASVLGLAFVAARRQLPAPRRWSVDHVILGVGSLIAALLVLRSASGWLYEWRLTAATIAATAPNWYVAMANLPAPRAKSMR